MSYVGHPIVRWRQFARASVRSFSQIFVPARKFDVVYLQMLYLLRTSSLSFLNQGVLALEDGYLRPYCNRFVSAALVKGWPFFFHSIIVLQGPKVIGR